MAGLINVSDARRNWTVECCQFCNDNPDLNETCENCQKLVGAGIIGKCSHCKTHFNSDIDMLCDCYLAMRYSLILEHGVRDPEEPEEFVIGHTGVRLAFVTKAFEQRLRDG